MVWDLSKIAPILFISSQTNNIISSLIDYCLMPYQQYFNHSVAVYLIAIPLLPCWAHTHRTELVWPRKTSSFSCLSTSHRTTVWSPEAVRIRPSPSTHAMSNIALLWACQSVWSKARMVRVYINEAYPTIVNNHDVQCNFNFLNQM